jgi:mannose-6-phosphate isomerase-like protein (cupin superfamily)
MNDQVLGRTTLTKKDQLENFVEKNWGHEEWIVNNQHYCGKKLVVKQGFCCSMHHHKVKDETFYLASGKVFLEMEENGKKSSRIMTPGDVQHIKIGLWHRFTGLIDSELFEFSTFHMDEDSYRREHGGAVDLKTLDL